MNICESVFKQRHDGLEVVFWTQVQRSGVQIPSFPRFFYFSYELCTVSGLGRNRPLIIICEFGKSYTFIGLNGSQHIEP